MNYIVVAVACVTAVVAHPYYRDQIPNGYSVPDPCHAGSVWSPVGHYDPVHHTIDKNPFGQVGCLHFPISQQELNFCAVESLFECKFRKEYFLLAVEIVSIICILYTNTCIPIRVLYSYADFKELVHTIQKLICGF